MHRIRIRALFPQYSMDSFHDALLCGLRLAPAPHQKHVKVRGGGFVAKLAYH